MSINYTKSKPAGFQDGQKLFGAELSAIETATDNGFISLEATIVDPTETVYNNQFRGNDIINGRFLIFNEGKVTADPATQDPADNAALAEMWFMDRSFSAGTIEVVQHPIALQNQHDFAMRANVLTTGAVGASDFLAMTYRMEGSTLREYDGRTGTLVFSAIGSEVGEYNVVFTNGTDRWYVSPFTISIAATWENYFIPFPFSTEGGGTWNYDESTGLYVHFVLAAGSSVQTATPGVWLSSAVWGSTSQIDWPNNASANFLIQNVWMFPRVATANASFAPPRDPRKITETQILTQRYFEKSWDLNEPNSPLSPAIAPEWINQNVPADVARGTIRYRVEKRINSPTVTIYAATTGTVDNVRVSSSDVASNIDTTDTTGFQISATVGANNSGLFYWTSDARLT